MAITADAKRADGFEVILPSEYKTAGGSESRTNRSGLALPVESIYCYTGLFELSLAKLIVMMLALIEESGRVDFDVAFPAKLSKH